MLLTVGTEKVELPAGPVWTVDNPEHLIEKKADVSNKRLRGLQYKRLMIKKRERMVRRIDREKAKRARNLEKDQLLDDEVEPKPLRGPSPDPTEPPLSLTDVPLRLDSATIKKLLEPFSGSIKIGDLGAHAAFRPYLQIPLACAKTKKRLDPDYMSSDDEAEEEDIQSRSRRADSHAEPNQAQKEVIRQFRNTTILHFIGLPSVETILKLVLVGENYTRYFDSAKLFPNVAKVVFSLEMQLDRLRYRHDQKTLGKREEASRQKGLFHPITFALDWLLNDFMLCIHSPTLSAKTRWINARVKKITDARGSTKRDSVAITAEAQQEWIKLGPLSGTIDLACLPSLKRLVYHRVLPGNEPFFRDDIDTTIYFGQHPDKGDAQLVLRTFQAIGHAYVDTTQIAYRLKLVNLEHLEHATLRQPGPKILHVNNERCQATRDALVRLTAIQRGCPAALYEPKDWELLKNTFEVVHDTRTDPYECFICKLSSYEPVCPDMDLEDPNDRVESYSEDDQEGDDEHEGDGDYESNKENHKSPRQSSRSR